MDPRLDLQIEAGIVDALVPLCRRIERSGARVVILTGAGSKAFSAGGDVAAWSGWSGTQRAVRRFGAQTVRRMALFGAERERVPEALAGVREVYLADPVQKAIGARVMAIAEGGARRFLRICPSARKATWR